LGAKQTEAELEIVLLLEDVIGKGNAPKEMEFKAKIDAVYKTEDGYLILDYKTDKTDENATGHRRQLATYKRLYSVANKIDEGRISTALGFIALRGKINTGKLEWKLDAQQPKPQQYETVAKYIRDFIGYKKDPELFIRELMGQADQGMLHLLVKQELSPGS
jgi:DNA helicase-2/ATP-dependent DNA helicase PcrA